MLIEYLHLTKYRVRGLEVATGANSSKGGSAGMALNTVCHCLGKGGHVHICMLEPSEEAAGYMHSQNRKIVRRIKSFSD